MIQELPSILLSAFVVLSLLGIFFLGFCFICDEIFQRFK